MRFAIDATPLMKPYRTGVAQYVLDLVRALEDAVGREDDLVLCYRLSRFSRRAFRLSPTETSLSRRWVAGPVHPARVRVFHGTDGRVRAWSGPRVVVTIHDVFSLETEEFASPGFRERRRRHYDDVAARADRILCVSGYARETFLKHYPSAADRTVVVPEGVHERFRPEAAGDLARVRDRMALSGPYVLCVGQISLRKNVSRILDAVTGMPEGSPTLVLAGHASHGHEDVAADVARRGLTERVLLPGYVADEDLPALYAGAECLLFPSLLEGFGLPALEAMASGIPVVTSDRGALPETTGGNAVFVDPEDAASIRDGLARVLEDRELREALVRDGLSWAGRFRWRDVARSTLELYRELA